MSRISYIDYSRHLQEKAQWSNSEIRRAVVTYQLSVKVQKKTEDITNKGKKLIIPDFISIERTSNENSTNGKSGKTATIKNIGLDALNMDLEGYKDAALGMIVFNKTGLPKSDCETYRSVAEIDEGFLYKSKLDNFSIFKYTRDNETVAVTLNHQMKSCNQEMYQTGVQNVEILLLDKDEKFLSNKHIELAEMEEEIVYESELRGAMNSIELAIDRMYKELPRVSDGKN